MAERISGLVWVNEPAGRDLHVLPGHATRPLLPDLRVKIPDPARAVFDDRQVDVPTFVASSPGAEFTFQPLFNALKVNDDWVAFGANAITVNASTGVVTVPAATPSLLKRNFLVEALLTLSPGNVMRQVIRIHVHLSVVRAWLTPGEITVRQGATLDPQVGPRFSVRAEFEDGVVGDLTLNHGVVWTAARAGRVTPEGFLRAAAADAPNDAIDVTATLPVGLGAKLTDPATLRVAAPWATDPALPKATSMTGGGSPIANPPVRTPNVLIVSDGFEKAHEGAFVTITDLILEQLRTSAISRPFDLLATSINFWRVFLPAAASGLSCREEVFISGPAGANRNAAPMPQAVRPPDVDPAAPLRPWDKVEHLLYVAGLPLPADAGRAPAAVRTQWGSEVSTEHTTRIGNATVVPDPLITAWVGMATRSMIDEIDGFPAVAMGVPPAASAGSATLAFHADRGGLPALEDFLRSLAADDGTTVPPAPNIGRIWARGGPACRFDNTEYVVLLSSYPGGRPLNSHPAIVVGLDSQRETFPVAKVPGRNAYTLLPKVPVKGAPHQTRLLAHELGHSFGLGDEYREFPGKDPQPDDRGVDIYANLQYASAVRDPGSNKLSSARIKWNWHRIRAAAVVDGPITSPAAGRFAVPVAPPQGLLFEPGQRVLLRKRVWGRPLGETPSLPLDRAHEARIVAPVSAASVVIEAGAGATLSAADLARFTPGSLIYAPVLGPSPAPTPRDEYAELIASNIRAYIDQDHSLTPVPCVVDKSKSTKPILPGVTLKAGFCGLCTPLIVGLYEGGNRYGCGVFRPAGECAMGPSEPTESKVFCPVCRYALVDAIDPTQHGALDEYYDDIYPV